VTDQETKTLALVPREGLFFKDGRGWGAGGAGRGRALSWPWPSSVAGALRTAYGRTLEHDRAAILTDPQWKELASQVALDWLLPLRRKQGEPSWTAADTMWPVPKDALTLRDGAVLTLRPHRSAAALPLDATDRDRAVAKLWHPRPVGMDDKSKPGKAPAWWTLGELVAWLCDKGAQAVTEQGRAARSMSVRTDIHLAVDPGTYAAEEGKLFVSDVVETLARVKRLDQGEGAQPEAGYWEWAVGVKVRWPAKAAGKRQVTDGPLTLGGKGRMAMAEAVEASVDTCPGELKDAFDAQKPRGLRLVAVTPCLFEKGGWLPDDWTVAGDELRGELEGIGLVLRAACVDRPMAVSGWDLVEWKPKATQLMVAPGAVWFVQRQDGGAFTGADAERLWMTRWGAEANNGAGRVVPGIWNVNEDNKKA
jgi:CRISPR-associated protein Cmr3